MSVEQAVVKDPVLLFKTLKERVLSNVALVRVELCPCSFALSIEVVHGVGQAANEIKSFSLCGSESCPLVEVRAASRANVSNG